MAESKIKNVDEKLTLLHHCLAIDFIPDKLPVELEEFEEDFLRFKELIKDCKSSQEDLFIETLSEFRDLLLKDEE